MSWFVPASQATVPLIGLRKLAQAAFGQAIDAKKAKRVRGLAELHQRTSHAGELGTIWEQ